jgi:hypothetical protein
VTAVRRLAFALAAGLAAIAAPSGAQATAVTQPAQPTSGPGSSATPYSEVRVFSGGKGADAWYVFEPVTPTTTTLPLAVVTHGYGEYSGNRMNGAIARHTALMGNVVIYTRWQTSLVTPCPGPFAIKGCIDAEVHGIRGALAAIKAAPTVHDQVDLTRASYFGFSFGGIITADIANRWEALGLPKPQAIWLDDPHDGGFTWQKEYALDHSLRGIPSTTKVVCHVGAEGVTTKSTSYSCGAVFPRLGHIPAANKSLVMSFPDDHGTPALSSKHGVCAGPAAGGTATVSGNTWSVDAYDWGFCWRSFDAMRDCAYAGANCQYALGDTPENRYMGTWSDGTPMIGLKIQGAAPIKRTPVPARAAAPAAAG